MPEGGFLEQKTKSPGGLAIVLAIHAAAIGALAMSKMEVIPKVFTPIKIKDVKVDDPPPPEPPPEPLDQKVEIRPKTQLDNIPAKVPMPPNDNRVVLLPQRDIPIYDPGPPGDSEARKPVDPPKPPPPLPDPVRTQAKLDPRSELQPPYPPSEQRNGEEGTVTVRLTVGADGRVKSVEKVRATSDAFYRATERHALRHWRFKPATLDGKPIESSTSMTVYFKIET